MSYKKKLYFIVLYFILTFNMYNIWNAEIIDPNEKLIENNDLNSFVEDNQEENSILEFLVAKKIIENLIKLLDTALENSIEQGYNQENFIHLLEEIGLKSIQEIIIKYSRNIKKYKDKVETETFSLDELKLFLKLIIDLLIKTGNESLNLNSIIINEINSVKDLNDIINTIFEKVKNAQKLIPTIPVHQAISILNNLLKTLNLTISLEKEISINLQKNKYIKRNLYDSLVHPNKIDDNKENNKIIQYQNEFLIPMIQAENEKLQKYHMQLNEMKDIIEKENKSMSIKKIEAICETFIDITLKELSNIEFLLKDSKFYPVTKKFNIKDPNKVNAEMALIEKNIKIKTKKLEEKYKIKTKGGFSGNEKVLLKKISDLEKHVINLHKTNSESILLPIQKGYKKIALALDHYSKANDFTKLLKKALTSEVFPYIGCTYVAIDFYCWFKYSSPNGFWQNIMKLLQDGNQTIQSGFSSSEKRGNTGSVFERINFNWARLMEFKQPNIKQKLRDERGYNALTEKNGSIDNLLYEPTAYLLSEEKIDLSPLTTHPAYNEQSIWTEEALRKYKELHVQFNEINNSEKHKINSLITSDILTNINILSSPESRLKEKCKKHNITNTENLDKIIKFAIDKETWENEASLQLKIYEEEFIRNLARNSIGQSILSIPGGSEMSSLAIGFGAKKFFNFLVDQEIGYLPNKIINKLNYFLNGEDQTQSDDPMQTIDYDSIGSNTFLFDPEFDHLRENGTLDWFFEVIEILKSSLSGHPHSDSEKTAKCIGLFGPSGSGKTYITKAFGNTIHKLIRESKAECKVEFILLEPRHFSGSMIDEKGKKISIDIVGELTSLIEQVRLKGGYYIIVFDEFHLIFNDNQNLADLLRLFNDINSKQKNLKTLGGIYVICATNKPGLLQHEFITNGDRIVNSFSVQHPTGSQSIAILKRELSKNNITLDHIDFDYLIPLLEGENLTYSSIIKIANRAFNIAKIKNKMVDNEVLYYAINEIVRKVIFFEKFDNPSLMKNIAAYYGALGSVAIHFNERNNKLYELDMLTTLPIKAEIIPQHKEKLYIEPETQQIRYGKAFFGKRPNNNEYDNETIAIEIIKAIAATVWLDSSRRPKINQRAEMAHIYDLLYHFYAGKVDFADCAKRLEIAEEKRRSGQDIEIASFEDTYNNTILHNKIIGILSKAEKAIADFYTKTEVKELTNKITLLLEEQKILRKSDILEDEECRKLEEQTIPYFKELCQKIQEIL